MNTIFKDYLFEHRIFVNEASEKSSNIFEIKFTLAKLFNIQITEGDDLVTEEMIHYAEEKFGQNVPEPFYRGFPESVRNLTSQQLLFDQMLHYAHTYGMGDFSKSGHSVMEEFIHKDAFSEKCEIRKFSVISEETAVEKLAEYIEHLLSSTRPVNSEQYAFIYRYIEEYDYSVKNCASKNTAIHLLLDSRKLHYVNFIFMSDVIKLVDEMNYYLYHNKNIKKLNLKNQDRKFITKVINYLFRLNRCDIRNCFEKKKVWNGLLHHIHYCPINENAEHFVRCMRGKKNFSVYSDFEKAMAANNICEAVTVLKKGKGSGAVLRHLNYMISRCKSEKEIQFVVDQIDIDNGIILMQLLMAYSSYTYNSNCRQFIFNRYNMLVLHQETEDEVNSRQSVIDEKAANLICKAIRKNLYKVYGGRLGKVYIDPIMKNIALPIQETASSGGYGVLPKGSRIHIEEGKKVRAFTYWEKVNDIDLSMFGICFNGSQIEFSWRNMWDEQSDVITFSGDETAGYNGGSEYFDINIRELRKKYPNIEYLMFCNNVYSRVPFDECVCRAGYMLRDEKDSGQVYEPKTVKTSFSVNGDSTFAYLFAIDLVANDFIWVNFTQDSFSAIAGENRMDWLKKFFHTTSVMNMYKFFSMLGKEIVDDPMDAEVIVSDQELENVEGAEIIRSWDVERILALINIEKIHV